MIVGTHHAAAVKIHTSRSMTSMINISRSESLFRPRHCKISGNLMVGDGIRMIGRDTFAVGGCTLTVAGGTRTVDGDTRMVNGGTQMVGGDTFTVDGSTQMVGGGTLAVDSSILIFTHLDLVLIYMFPIL
jgi:hypothetical protein